MHVVEEGPEEVCLIDTVLQEHAKKQQQHDVLIEELSDCSEEFQETQELRAVHGSWRKKEEVLPLLTEEDKEKKRNQSASKV